MMNKKILDIKNLSFQYKNPDSKNQNQWTTIFKDINLSVNQGSIIGIAGKSGCGKTTLAKAIVDYHHLSGAIINKDYKMCGNIIYHENNVKYANNNKSFKNYRSLKPPPIQMVFQDPRTALNMKMKLYYQLKESIKLKMKNNDIKSIDFDDEINRIADTFKIREHLYSTPTVNQYII